MIARPCLEPGCPSIATERGRCVDHAKPAERERHRRHDETRGSASQRGYGSQWQKVRRLVLARSPLCNDCERRGATTEAQEVHHIDGDSRNNQFENLMPLCKQCHSRRTMQEQVNVRRIGKSFL